MNKPTGKKAASGFIFIFFWIVLSFMSANSAFGGKAGDINNSGVTDLADAIISLQVSADVEPEEVVYKEYEISGDKKADYNGFWGA